MFASKVVFLRTTKRGRAGKSHITFSGYNGWQATSETIPMLNAQQYVEIFNESAKNDGYDPDDYDFTPACSTTSRVRTSTRAAL